MGGGSTTSTVTNSAQLPPEMRAYVQGAGTQGLAALQAVRPRLQEENRYVADPRQVAGFAPDQTNALNMARDTATQGNPLLGAGMDYATAAARGDYLNSNPYVDQVLGAETDRILNSVGSQFELAGRYGSGQNAKVAAREIANSSLPYLSANYEAERGRQENAIGMLPMFDAARYTDAQALAGVGDTIQGQQQREFDAQYDADANAKTRMLEQQIALGNLGIGTGSVQQVGAGNTQTTSQPSNTFGNALGGIGLGAQVGSAFGPWGTAAGAVGGGLYGLFG